MKAFATSQSVRFVPTNDEAAILGEAAQLKMLSENHWAIVPADPNQGRIHGISKRTDMKSSYRYCFGLKLAGLDLDLSVHDHVDLETTQCENGFMVKIPEDWRPERRVAQARIAERREADGALEALKDALLTINGAIIRNEATAFLKDDLTIGIRTVMEI